MVLSIGTPGPIDLDGGIINGNKHLTGEIWAIPLREMLPPIAYFEEHRRANIQKAQLWDEAVLYGAVSLFNQ